MEAPSYYLNLLAKVFLHNFKAGFWTFFENYIYDFMIFQIYL